MKQPPPSQEIWKGNQAIWRTSKEGYWNSLPHQRKWVKVPRPCEVPLNHLIVIPSPIQGMPRCQDPVRYFQGRLLEQPSPFQEIWKGNQANWRTSKEGYWNSLPHQRKWVKVPRPCEVPLNHLIVIPSPIQGMPRCQDPVRYFQGRLLEQPSPFQELWKGTQAIRSTSMKPH